MKQKEPDTTSETYVLIIWVKAFPFGIHMKLTPTRTILSAFLLFFVETLCLTSGHPWTRGCHPTFSSFLLALSSCCCWSQAVSNLVSPMLPHAYPRSGTEHLSSMSSREHRWMPWGFGKAARRITVQVHIEENSKWMLDFPRCLRRSFCHVHSSTSKLRASGFGLSLVCLSLAGHDFHVPLSNFEHYTSRYFPNCIYSYNCLQNGNSDFLR